MKQGAKILYEVQLFLVEIIFHIDNPKSAVQLIEKEYKIFQKQRFKTLNTKCNRKDFVEKKDLFVMKSDRVA